MEFKMSQDRLDAERLDLEDPLAHFRKRFHFPQEEGGTSLVYFCGHSLGLQPIQSLAAVEEVMNDWASMGVEKWFSAENSWHTASNRLRPSIGRLLGALPEEVTVMNSLTVNIHLLLASFYQPTSKRFKIITDAPVFPSDLHALKSQIRLKGGDLDSSLVVVQPSEGESYLQMDRIEQVIKQHGEQIALVWFNGVNFLTGQHYDLASLTRLTHTVGAMIGLDLAHAIGNVPLALHDWGVDCAVWCHYKYLNSGPGSVGGAFVHEKHYKDQTFPTLCGWWGDKFPERFDRSIDDRFVPELGANGWQVSSPSPIQAKLLESSLQLFDEAGFDQLRDKSVKLTSFLEESILRRAFTQFKQLTPDDPGERGAQLSFAVEGDAELCQKFLRREGIVCDRRAPNVIRLAPCPLYNSFQEVALCVEAIAKYDQMMSERS